MTTKAAYLLSIIAAYSYALMPVSAIGEEIAKKCYDVYCITIACNPGEQQVMHPGDCCPSCEAVLYDEVITASNNPVDCSHVRCKEPICGQGITPVVNPGECCAVCPHESETEAVKPDCNVVKCTYLLCADGYEPFTPPGQCCPTSCQKVKVLDNCFNVHCIPVVCEPGEIKITLKGECCPKCITEEAAELELALFPPINCTAVLCLEPICEEGETPVTPPGQCCARCQRDCSAVTCLRPLCEEGETLEVPPGECCPLCERPNCAAVLCRALDSEDCNERETAVIPPGECCARCQLDCSTVFCQRPICEEGQTLEVPPGECCPMCVPPRPQCEVEGQIFSDCASPCPRTCESPNRFCTTVCKPGCTCPTGQVIDTVNYHCVPQDECPNQDCPYKGQIFSFCPGCDSTCIDDINEETRVCPAVCRPGCGCPGAQLIDTIAGKCVARDRCTNPCATVDCAPGSRCKVYRPTGEAFCEPSCNINNGGCAADQICQLNQVRCVRAPCPPVVECLDAEVCSLEPETGLCLGFFERFFHNATTGQCETFIYGGCGGNANNFGTLEKCQSTCVVDPCATVTCNPGHHCEIYEPTGEPFCNPNCSINNGGCCDDKKCTLKVVQCVRAPIYVAMRCVL